MAKKCTHVLHDKHKRTETLQLFIEKCEFPNAALQITIVADKTKIMQSELNTAKW